MRTEDEEQTLLARYLDARGDLLWCHVPNGGKRHIGTAKKLKAQGVKRGVPDVLIFTRTKQHFIGAALELKRLRGGKASEEQKCWMSDLALEGWYTAVIRGAAQSISVVEKLYGVIENPETKAVKMELAT